MKQFVGGIVIAALASLVTLQFVKSNAVADEEQPRPAGIRFTEPSEQDAWVTGVSRSGEPRLGAENDEKPLADATNSVCFLTKVEIKGQNDPGDVTSCYVSLDEFTGWWQINAEKGEGSDASVACNARCLVWD
jgi:hypothetical protein